MILFIEKNRYKILFPLLGFVMAISACHAPRMAELPAMQAVPEPFAVAGEDTAASMANVPWRQFFPDSRLVKLIDTAIANNLDLQIALQRIEVASAYLLKSKGALLPVVSLDADASATRYGKYTMEGVGNYDTNLSGNINDDQKTPVSPTPSYWLGLNASWEADIWGKLKNTREADRLRLLATLEGRQAVYAALVTQVAGLYYTLQGLEQERAIVEENIDLQQKALSTVEVLKEGGRANELAVRQFNAQLLNTQGVAYEIKQRQAATHNQLNVLLGRFQGTVALSDSILPIEQKKVKIGFMASLVEQRPDIRQAGFQLQAAQADLKAARAAFFPRLTINGYTAFNAFKANLLFSGSSLAYSLAGGLTAPVLQRSELKSRFKVATAEQQTAFFQYRSTVINAYQEVLTGLQQWEGNRNIYERKKEEVAVLAGSIESANDLYVGGYANYLEIITAQKNKLIAQLELVNAQKNIMLSLVDVYRAVGGGWK